MEERASRAGGFRKDTVGRLLRLHFRHRRTRVNADAQVLMAEFLKVFVRGHDNLYKGLQWQTPQSFPGSLLCALLYE